ncbi:hypothetical protein NL676_009270 [Syzygium grande]|nr:hypothetical protein NL676_009270 [Syzygium grande]
MRRVSSTSLCTSADDAADASTDATVDASAARSPYEKQADHQYGGGYYDGGHHHLVALTTVVMDPKKLNKKGKRLPLKENIEHRQLRHERPDDDVSVKVRFQQLEKKFQERGSKPVEETKLQPSMLKSHANVGKSNNPYKKFRVHKMEGPESDQYAVNFCEEDEYFREKMKELLGYIEMVQQIVKPGCSPEVVEVALHSMASLVKFLSSVSSKTELISSL